MAFVGAYQGTSGAKRAFSFSLLFILGLTITFTLLGLVAALMGRMVGDVGNFWPYLVAAVCLVMGLHLLDVLKFDLPLVTAWRPQKAGPLGAFLLGLLFGVVSTPCATPIRGPSGLHSLQGKPAGALLLCVRLSHCLDGRGNLHGARQTDHRVQGIEYRSRLPAERERGPHHSHRLLFYLAGELISKELEQKPEENEKKTIGADGGKHGSKKVILSGSVSDPLDLFGYVHRSGVGVSLSRGGELLEPVPG
jgi:hypothetical protein